MTNDNVDRFLVKEIALGDKRVRGNKLCSRMTGKPGLSVRSGTTYLLPHIFMQNEQFACVCLSGRELLRFLQSADFHIFTQVDVDSRTIPMIGQRIPIAARRRAIRQAWADESRTPDHKVETIELGIYNTEVTPSHGIKLNGNSLTVVGDGAGRMSAALDEIADLLVDEESLDRHPIMTRELIFQFNIDLSGDPVKGLKTFLSSNRDPKRVTTGTVLSVEAGLNAMLSDKEVEMDYDNPLARNRVITTLFKSVPNRSVLSLLPWKFEGSHASKGTFASMRGSSASLATALKELRKDLKRSDVPIDELADALSLGFQCWFDLCPQCVRRIVAQDASCRFTSTLALKVMVLLSVRLYAYTGDDKSSMSEYIEKVIRRHFRTHKTYPESYPNSKRKKMTPDLFFQENGWFASRAFNSGAKNTEQMLQEFRIALSDVLGEGEDV